MEKKIKILLILGVLITILLLFFDIYIAGMAAIIFIVLLMSFHIMQDTVGIPEIVAKFREDGKAIILTNTGNARAEKIHATLIPGPDEYDIPFLDADSSYTIPLSAVLEDIKILITYSNDNERVFSSTSKLSLFDEEPDLLKPMIPMFKWKK
jgi:hypothetical protein